MQDSSTEENGKCIQSLSQAVTYCINLCYITEIICVLSIYKRVYVFPPQLYNLMHVDSEINPTKYKRTSTEIFFNQLSLHPSLISFTKTHLPKEINLESAPPGEKNPSMIMMLLKSKL